ncbi:hypothetical protein B0H14DRAFT_2610501 [Mycena olivaceomarginata]|nr:hypothetical protein B0H14DRAFT_2610501 [Mycena olivaceomarginata]
MLKNNNERTSNAKANQSRLRRELTWTCAKPVECTTPFSRLYTGVCLVDGTVVRVDLRLVDAVKEDAAVLFGNIFKLFDGDLRHSVKMLSAICSGDSLQSEQNPDPKQKHTYSGSLLAFLFTPFWREGGVGSGEGERKGCTGDGVFKPSCWLSGDEPNTRDGLSESSGSTISIHDLCRVDPSVLIQILEAVSSTIGEGLKKTGWHGTIDEGTRQELLSEREDLPASTWLTQYHLFFCPTLCKFREKRLDVIIPGPFKLTLRHESVQRWNGKMRAKEGGGRSRKRMRNKWQMRNGSTQGHCTAGKILALNLLDKRRRRGSGSRYRVTKEQANREEAI